MELSIKHSNLYTLLIGIDGRLDLDSAVDFGHQVMDAIDDSEEEVKEIILDFEKVTFISSYGLKVILEFYKKMKERNGSLKIKNVSEEIRKSFNLVGFNKFLALD